MQTILPPLIDHQPRDTEAKLFAAFSTEEHPAALGSSALVHTNVPVGFDGPILPGFSALLGRRHGLSLDAATVINLAVLSASIGPSKMVRNPLGGMLNAGLNVIVVAGADVRRAALQAMTPFQKMIDRAILAHRETGPKHRRQFRMELESECAIASRQLRNPPEKSLEPLTIPVPRAERKMEALPGALAHAENVVEQTRSFEFEEKPFVMIDGLDARDIPQLAERSFDGALLNYSPDVVQPFEARRDRDVLRYMKAAWHGRPFVAAAQTVTAPVMTNFWLIDGDPKALDGRVLTAAGLSETFLVVPDHHCPEHEAVVNREAEKAWEHLVKILMNERIVGEIEEYTLSEPAAERFLEFRAGLRQPGRDHKPTSWWPEQILKIALILHVSSHDEVPDQIDVATVEQAIEIVERVGVGQHSGFSDFQSDKIEAEIQIMVTKVRFHGRLTKRELFRKYNDQRYERREPILALCRERGQVEVVGDWIYPVKALL